MPVTMPRLPILPSPLPSAPLLAQAHLDARERILVLARVQGRAAIAAQDILRTRGILRNRRLLFLGGG
jgi:hypothetical protein